MSDIVGVDFGTSTSLLAVSTIRGAQTLPIGQTNKWIPSIAGLDGASWSVGDDAADLEAVLEDDGVGEAEGDEEEQREDGTDSHRGVTPEPTGPFHGNASHGRRVTGGCGGPGPLRHRCGTAG